MRSDLPTLEELRLLDRADVYKAGVFAGRLVRGSDRVEFVYDGDYVAAGGEAVATTLPTSQRSVAAPAGAVPAYFAGLLPEGRRLSALRAGIGTSADDELSVLLAVGGDAVGDVRVVPPGAPPDLPALEPPGALDEVSFTELFARVVGADPDRVALAGVQDKVSGRMINVPVRGRGAGVLLKLDPPEFPHLVANEAFFIGSALDSGLRTVAADVVHDRDGRPGLLVTRFDREPADDGDVRSLAVEDGCQLTGRWPADKYRLETAEVIGALAGACGAPVVAAHELLRLFVFAYLTGNGDLHAKNLAVVRDLGGEWRVSPAYDLPSSAPYGDVDLALPAGARIRSSLSVAAIVGLGAAVGVPERAVLRTLEEQVACAERWWRRLTELPFDQHRAATLARLTRRRRERLGADLDATS